MGKNIKSKIKEASERCARCLAEVEVMFDNSKLSVATREKIDENLMVYCPICTIADEKQ